MKLLLFFLIFFLGSCGTDCSTTTFDFLKTDEEIAACTASTDLGLEIYDSANPGNTSTNFGGIDLNTSTVKDFTVTNTSTDKITSLTSVDLLTPFAYSGDSYPGDGGTCDDDLDVGESCSLIVKFSPTTSDSFADWLTLSYEVGGQSSSYSHRIEGSGLSSSSSTCASTSTTASQTTDTSDFSSFDWDSGIGLAQSIYLTESKLLDSFSIKMYLTNSGDSISSVTLDIQSNSSSSLPSGTSITSASVTSPSLDSTSNSTITFDFSSSRPTLSAETTYWFVIKVYPSSGSAKISGASTDNSYSSGAAKWTGTAGVSWQTIAVRDIAFTLTTCD